MREPKLDAENMMKEMMFKSNKRMSKIKVYMENLLKSQSDKGKEKMGSESLHSPRGEVYTPPHH